MPDGRLNEYVCQDKACGHVMVTVDVGEGTTPFITKCPKCCCGLAQSRFYRCDQNQTPTHEWYRPSEVQARSLDLATRQHVQKGGLILREVTPHTLKLVTVRREAYLSQVRHMADIAAARGAQDAEARVESMKKLDLLSGVPRVIHTTHHGQFLFSARDSAGGLTEHPIDDPFIRTEIRVRGFRNAVRVLLGRFKMEIQVRGKHSAVYRAVMTADYTPDPPRDPQPSCQDQYACSQSPPQKTRINRMKEWLANRHRPTSSRGPRKP